MRLSGRHAAALGAVVCALAACGGPGGDSSSGSASAPPAGTAAPGPAAALQDAFVKVVEKVRPSVVQVQNSTGLGSGIVFDANGDVVTNAHVVGNDQSFRVTSVSGVTDNATLVGKFAPGDLAVIRVSNGHQLPAATFADSSALKVGDLALAIGNPLGLSSSVTEGIVSAVGRTVPEGASVVLPDAIQTSAAINPGNSGGALVDISGNVIGIPTLAALDPELGGSAAPGIGFAIPSNTARDIAGQLIASGKVTNSHRADLGVAQVSTVADANGNPVGVVVGSVAPGGPADRAGLKAGDIIVAIQGQAVTTAEALAVAIAMLQPGQTVDVAVQRADGLHHVSVTLGQYAGS